MKDSFDIKKSVAYAELSISGVNMDYEKLTNLLRLEIEFVRAPNDYSGYSKSGVIISPARYEDTPCAWLYKTENKFTDNITKQIEELRLIFKDKIHIINDLKTSHPDYEMNVCIVLNNHQEKLPGMAISRDQIYFLSQLNMHCEFDLYLNLDYDTIHYSIE